MIYLKWAENGTERVSTMEFKKWILSQDSKDTDALYSKFKKIYKIIVAEQLARAFFEIECILILQKAQD